MRSFSSLVQLSSLALLATLQPTLADVYTSPDQLRYDSYDFIVVGGGTAGLVVANRLTEESYTVLVLESGGSHNEDLLISVPFFCGSASFVPLYDWNYTTVAQTGLDGRQLGYPRGHLLGGSSSINYLGYSRGTKDDYNRYADITGDEGWSWDNLQPYVFKSEKLTPPADLHDTTGQYDPSAHGTDGLHPDSLPGYQISFDDKIIQTTQELSDEFPFNLDTNAGDQLGVGWIVSTVANGERSSSATSYLADEYATRSNLDVLIGAKVLRVLSDANSTSDVPVFSEVEYVVNGETFTATAEKEIVLSAGSVGTPAILLHSGIGDASELSALGVTPIVDLPSVGKNFTDHLTFTLSWAVNSTDTFEQYTTNDTRMGEALAEWQISRTGPMTLPLANHVGFFRLDDIDESEDPAAGPETGHYELLFSNGWVGAPVTEGNFMTILAVIIAPSSRGSLSITSNDPTIAPSIDPNFLTTSIDKKIGREAFRAALRFVESSAFEGYINTPSFNVTSDNDDEIDAFIRQAGGSIGHPVASAAMSPFDAEYGVTDPDLKVKGAQGLRVVDASVIPRIPAAHTQIPVYIFAERGADLIKASWSYL